jgi:4-amino-4-deoxy-L-arabinose transferase-like glycosyltransferase
MQQNTKTQSRWNIPLIILLFVVLLLKITTLVPVQNNDPESSLKPDSSSYVNPARALAESGAYSHSILIGEEWPETRRTPGYPLFLSFFLKLWDSLLPALIAQTLISLATILLVFKIAQLVWNESIALLAALVYAFDHTTFLFSHIIHTETLFTFLLVLCVYFGVLFLRQEKRKWLLLFSLTLACSAMVRPISYYLIIPATLGFLIHVKWSGRGWREVGVALLLLIIPWLAITGGWTWRNYAQTGSAEFCHIKGKSLYLYRAVGVVALRDNISEEEARQKLLDALPDTTSWSEARLYDYQAEEGMRIIKQHPLLFAKTIVWGLIKIIADPGLRDPYIYFGIEDADPALELMRLPLDQYLSKWVLHHPILFVFFLLALAYLGLVYLGGTYAIWILLKERRDVILHLYLWGVIFYFVLIAAGPEAYARFRIPFMPFLSMYAAVGLSAAWSNYRNRKGNAPILTSSNG